MRRAALLLAVFLCAALVRPAQAASCSTDLAPAVLAQTGLTIYREAVALAEGSERVRALEQAAQCLQLAQRQSRSSAARMKLNHPLGLVYEKLGRSAAAYAALDAFRREVSEAQRLPGVSAQIDAKLAALRPRVGLLSLSAPAGTTIRVDGEEVGTAPFDHLVALSPGPHLALAVPPGGAPQTMPVQAVAGRVARLTVTGPAPLPAESEGVRRARVLRRSAIGTLVVGAVLVGAGATFWGIADRPTCGDPGGPVSCPQLLPPAGLGIGLVAGGAAMLGVSLTLYLRSRTAR